jgi:hypothetical protein
MLVYISASNSHMAIVLSPTYTHIGPRYGSHKHNQVSTRSANTASVGTNCLFIALMPQPQPGWAQASELRVKCGYKLGVWWATRQSTDTEHVKYGQYTAPKTGVQ